MRSSTSNSEAIETPKLHPPALPPVHYVHRVVPDRNWLAMAGVALLVTAGALALWERHVRTLGYEADYDDTTSLWAEQRQRLLGVTVEQWALVGDSRTLFDLDLDLLESATGKRPVQLATVGSNPIVIMTHLAEDPTFAGTVLLGVSPPLLAAAGGPPMANPRRYVRKFREWSPANAWEAVLSRPLQEQFAFVQQEDLTLKQLILGLPWPNREGAFAPKLPPHFSQLDLDRRTRMIERVDRDTAFRDRLRAVWPPLFSGPPRPAVFSEEAWAKIFADAWTATLVQAKKNVETIRARGGRVIFVRMPSSGPVREIEDRITPRNTHWDRLLRETEAPGIYYLDHPELSGFDCPEYSHLNASDSVVFTRNLIAVLRRRHLLD
jgi:hypothetical protein